MYTTRRTAELIKYAANAFLATKITFINEMADLAEQAAPTSRTSRAESGQTTALARNFSMPARALAAPFFPKDTRALVKTALDHGVQLRVVEATIMANDNRKRGMARKVAHALGGDVRGALLTRLSWSSHAVVPNCAFTSRRRSPTSSPFNFKP